MTETYAEAKSYIAVIDIGSNSVRLVVFSGLCRVPDTVFNEKIMCGLGSAIGTTGSMSEESVELAISTLKRYRALCDQMGVGEIVSLATAAVRDAGNGEDFVRRVKEECRLDIQVIEGPEEARLSALGVLSGEPSAKGVIGDLGGGSLELVRIHDGDAFERRSLEKGPLRLMSKFGDDMRAMRQHVKNSLMEVEWLDHREGDSFYLVGGAWRNIARLMMKEQSNPLPILQGYRAAGSEMAAFCDRLAMLRPADIPFGDLLNERRRQVIPVAAMILREVLRVLRPRYVIVSSFGLREGVLFDRLTPEKRAEDPFLYSCRHLAEERCRFTEHADILFDWTRPLFRSGDTERDVDREMLHMATCLLSDVAWRGHPDFRAEKAVETVLHGNFVGVTHRERAYVALALNQAYGAPLNVPHVAGVLQFLKVEEIHEARVMGAALRLAQRLSGGAADALKLSSLTIARGKIVLSVPKSQSEIANDVVFKRLLQLGQLLGRQATIQTV
ncbi:Ppx/GppA family phosphatase [Gimibacter soli]|uniref:Ppx/GppA family phosphatase n=1 Tax=Gimibacter soli TaxID=3024400 RepID=A0AAF0BFS4_9PROT|nr:Ppx/GppA family phosphatase [Gimibacter soli]WCL52813.1 Ppx/GppA family phosphatase [Gimibacter soli]